MGYSVNICLLFIKYKGLFVYTKIHYLLGIMQGEKPISLYIQFANIDGVLNKKDIPLGEGIGEGKI